MRRSIRFNIAAFFVLVVIGSLFGTVDGWSLSIMAGVIAGLYLGDILRAIERKYKIDSLKYSEMDEPR